jgi:CRISPR/Cas system CMR subunit Cmr4 (Cas7 group RAMP superfamily)
VHAVLLTQERMQLCALWLAAAALVVSAITYIKHELHAATTTTATAAKDRQSKAEQQQHNAAQQASNVDKNNNNNNNNNNNDDNNNNYAQHFAGETVVVDDNVINDALPLAELSRKQLQALAKRHGVAANIASREIVVRLQELHVA